MNGSLNIMFLRCHLISQTVDTIKKCILDLKNGKAARIDGLVAEHIRFAHPILHDHTVCLFLMMYKHSIVPDDFGKGIVIPLIKEC